MAATNAFEVLGKKPKPLLTQPMESVARKYPQWRSRIMEMGKIATYRKKSYKELCDILTNENYSRSGLSSVKENLTSLVDFINGKLTKVVDSSLSISEQKTFVQSATSKITALKDKIKILSFGGQLYVKTHRSVKKFIGLLELKGVYIEANDHGQYQIESENLSSLIALKDCLENDLEQFVTYIVKRGEINRQCNLDLQDKSVCVRSDAKTRKQRQLDALVTPRTVYIPLAKVLLATGNGHIDLQVEGEVDPENEQCNDSLGHDESQGDEIEQNEAQQHNESKGHQNEQDEKCEEYDERWPGEENKSDVKIKEEKEGWEEGQDTTDCWGYL